jgi:outer membrane protein assembly factor BamD (BamD/ComL family)
LHYVDAFYATKGHAYIGGHGRRRHLLRTFTETSTIEEAHRLLEKASREARYEGEPFDQADLERSKRLYADVRTGMRRALRL